MEQNEPGVKWILLARKCFLNIHITRFLCLLHCHKYADLIGRDCPRVEDFEKMILRARHLFKSRVQITEDAGGFGGSSSLLASSQSHDGHFHLCGFSPHINLKWLYCVLLSLGIYHKFL